MIQRPSRRGNRPSALDLSFGLDTDDSTAGTTASDGSRKRNRDDAVDPDIRGTKRRNLDSAPLPARKYEPRSYEFKETRNLLLSGEEPTPKEYEKKRIRVLSHFAFFDTELNMVSLDLLDKNEKNDQHILGAGFVVGKFDFDEDEDEGLDEEAERQYVCLSRVHRYFTDYLGPNSLFYVETEHAIYELDLSRPSKKYRSHFRPFWKLQSTLRFVISSAHTDPAQEYSAFKSAYESKDNEVFGDAMTERDLWEAVPKLRDTLEIVSFADNLRESTVIRYLLSHIPPVVFKPVAKAKARLPEPDIPVDYKGSENVDQAALRSRTCAHVTPRIARLAFPLFREKIKMVGYKPRDGPEVPKDDLILRLRQFLTRAQNRRLTQFRPDQRIGRSHWLKYIMIDGAKYEVGDTILIYSGADIPSNLDDLPQTDTLADYFWFGRIICLNEEHETVHVHWFAHSSSTLLQELGHSQELFLTNQCDVLELGHIIGKIKNHYIEPDQSLADVNHHDYFYRYSWDEYEGVFANIDMNALSVAGQEPPGDNCPVCELQREFEVRLGPEKIHLGVRSHGVGYHFDDFVRIKADEGPCHIGHIVSFVHYGSDDTRIDVVVRLLGRIDRVGCRPSSTLKDERHLFCTQDEMTIPISDLIGICQVVVKDDMPELDAWLAMSPYRFYVRYRFPSLSVTSWESRRRVRWNQLPVCHICLKQDLKKFKGIKAFLEDEAPLRVLDPFSGVGAFGLSMQELGCFKLTHAVEITPSAADTLKAASPNTRVYNQCSNKVLNHAILTHEGKNPEPLKSFEDRPLPPPIKPGDIDCIVTGFPCQSHSTMNMFPNANEGKSTLILTALSYVDFLKPKYCIFEHVRGFLQFSLRARQAGKHAVKGGIPMGGLKFVAAALLDMGYQLRCGLLQAGHYGTPQTRVRFLLIAAKRGLDLPPFPQPTHDFPIVDALKIKLPEGPCLSPITTLPGIAPHRYVSVHDAISDLPRFDWKHPKEKLNKYEMERKRVKECLKEDNWCGYDGPNVPYEHPPQTRFQQNCRSRPTKDIQQYTHTYEPIKVERVVEIPIEADADYRSLPRHLWEWQFSNPASANARRGFKKGYYGRIERDKWFQTTVTNVDPMAKQCRVIHPYSRRVVTVRELARSQGFPDHFVFHARNNRVRTMHREIGNAIPWTVSSAIAREFLEMIYKDWEKRNPVDEPRDVVFSDEDEGMDVD